MGILSSPDNDHTSYLTLINVIALLFTWLGGTVVYRLWLGPLAAFPGPRLAALTGWYETYFDCFQRGRYWVEIEKMHAQYGKPKTLVSNVILTIHARSNCAYQPVGIARE